MQARCNIAPTQRHSRHQAATAWDTRDATTWTSRGMNAHLKDTETPMKLKSYLNRLSSMRESLRLYDKKLAEVFDVD